MMGENVSAETVDMAMKTVAVKASVEVVERVRGSKVVVQVTCTVLEGKGNRCSTRGVSSEDLAG